MGALVRSGIGLWRRQRTADAAGVEDGFVLTAKCQLTDIHLLVSFGWGLLWTGTAIPRGQAQGRAEAVSSWPQMAHQRRTVMPNS
jgi:hypothetical protein